MNVNFSSMSVLTRMFFRLPLKSIFIFSFLQVSQKDLRFLVCFVSCGLKVEAGGEDAPLGLFSWPNSPAVQGHQGVRALGGQGAPPQCHLS